MCRVAALWVLTLLCGCAHAPPDADARAATADAIATTAGWQRLRVRTEMFVLAAYASPPVADTPDVLTVYIEGDGLAWLNVSTASTDPTPLNPLALKLAVRDPGRSVAWLARPCQYTLSDAPPECSIKWWTSHRFAEEVIAASTAAIDQLKRRVNARHIALVGYSGGGAVAALVAARRSDVIHLTTVAGNLDHRMWTQWHALTPLSGSLDAADVASSLAGIAQTHWVGGRDKIIGRRLADAFAARAPRASRPQINVLAEADHYCCWDKYWPLDSGGH